MKVSFGLELLREYLCIFNRVGPDIRQCRIIRPDFSFCRISGRIIRYIRPDLAGTGHPATGKKYQIRPNPSFDTSYLITFLVYD